MSTTAETIVSPPITISPVVDALYRYKRFLQIASLFLPKPLTETEINILDEFYSVSKGEITTESRKKVYENLGMSTHQLNNYIGLLRKRNIIKGDWINKSLLPNIPESNVFTVVVSMKIQ